MTILEAMAAGVTIIATSVGAVPIVIQDAVNGFLVKPGDPEALARAMGIMISDPARRNRFGNRAIQDVRAHFSVETMTEKYMKAYRGILR